MGSASSKTSLTCKNCGYIYDNTDHMCQCKVHKNCTYLPTNPHTGNEKHMEDKCKNCETPFKSINHVCQCQQHPQCLYFPLHPTDWHETHVRQV